MPDAETDLDLNTSRTFILRDGELLSTVAEEDARLPQALAPGTMLDSKYKIVSLLGEGGMGSVYLVHHMLLDKDMALKTFRSPQNDKERARRFELEARAIAKLSHKNIVQVFDCGVTADGRPFYTMELLRGTSLVKYISERSLSLRETLEIFREVADGLAHAHKAGIIHRDIKPDNIHLGAPTGKAGKISSVKIVDFGIAKLAMVSNADNSTDQSGRHDQMLTKVGRVFGSPLYMSPEQSIGQPTDHRTDIYSFGCTLFEAITGRPPFVGKDSRSTLSSHRLEPPPTLAQCAPDRVFPQRLEALLARLLEKDQKDRFQSCLEIRREIRRILATLAEGHVPGGEETIAQKAETSLRPDNTRQAKTDPLIAADRAISRFLQASPKVIVTAALVGLAAVATVFVWQTGKNNWLKGGIQKNNLHGATFRATTPPLSVPVKATALDGKGAPAAKYLLRQTATVKIFKFPLGEPIGMLRFGDCRVLARGQVEVPKNCDCSFRAERPIALAPQLLGGFGPNDLSAIEFPPTDNWKDEHIKWVDRLTGLKHLNLDNCDLTATSIDYINNLSNLRKIYFDGTHVETTQWCRLRRLSQLTEIKAEALHDSLALLTKLKQKNSLENLEIKGSDVSDAGMATIASFKGLIRLTLIGNTVTSKGLKALLALPKLEFLSIAKSRVGPDSVETLAAMPALKELAIQTSSWGVGNQRHLNDLMLTKGVKLTQTRPGSLGDR